MVIYVDTSAILRVALEGQPELIPFLQGADRRFTSALTRVEIDRGVLRSRFMGRIDRTQENEIGLWIQKFYAGTEIIPLDREILSRARKSFPVEPFRTLDAIHLASAQRLEGRFSSLAVASHDNRLRANAEALGFELLPISSAAS